LDSFFGSLGFLSDDDTNDITAASTPFVIMSTILFPSYFRGATVTLRTIMDAGSPFGRLLEPFDRSSQAVP